MRLNTRKENVVADALTRIPSGELYALVVSIIFTNITDKARKTWENDVVIQVVLQDIIINPASYPHYS